MHGSEIVSQERRPRTPPKNAVKGVELSMLGAAFWQRRGDAQPKGAVATRNGNAHSEICK
jgi:hypothetical protein